MSDQGMDPQRRELPVSFWHQKWEEEKTTFHNKFVNPTVMKYHEVLTEGKKRKVLVPLCGKSLDVAWLYEFGHTVVGVEAVEKPVQEFFKENNLEPTVKEIGDTGFKVYSTTDGRLKIFVCNIFQFSKSLCGMSFDAVWDRGSFVAISGRDRKSYSRVIDEVVESGGKILLECYEYDTKEHTGPPFVVKMEDLQELYGSSFEIEHLYSYDALLERHKLEWGVTKLLAANYLLTRK